MQRRLNVTLLYDQQVNQDFLLLFGAETATKLLEKWDTSFKPKVIKEAKQLTPSTDLCHLLKSCREACREWWQWYAWLHVCLTILIFIFTFSFDKLSDKFHPKQTGTVTWLLCCYCFIFCHLQLDGRGGPKSKGCSRQNGALSQGKYCMFPHFLKSYKTLF